MFYSARDNNSRLLSSTEDPKLQVLVLGGSSARGHGLAAPGSSYPNLLPFSVTNLSPNFTSPVYPSLCADSLLRDSHYDAIILDYSLLTREAEGAAKRLRRRYPLAALLFLGLWNPYRAVGSNENGFADARAWGDPSYKWEFTEEYREYGRKLHSLAEEVGGTVIVWQGQEIASAEQMLAGYSRFFAEDRYHLSKEGHQEIAQMIVHALSHVTPTQGAKVHPVDDFCVLWEDHGDCPLTASPGITLETYTPGKYALRFPPWGGTLTVNNPFSTPRNIFLSYLITERPIYPKVRVQVHPASDAIILDPIFLETRFPLHAVRSTVVGVAQPGDNRVYIHSTERQKAPFRVVGIGIVAQDSGPLDLGMHLGT